MHIKRLGWMLLAILPLGCVQEPLVPEEPDGGLALSIEGAIDQVATRATAAGFVDGDAIGLYAVNYSVGNTASGTLLAEGNQADNAKYVFDEAAWKWTPVHPVYYKDVNTHVDLYVYYPWLQRIDDVTAYGFEVQKDQSSAAADGHLGGYEASDFLWCKAEDITPTESRIRVRLAHRMAGVGVVLQEGTGFGEGEFALLGKTVLVTGTTRKATIDFTTGTVTALGGPQVDGIVMAPQEDGAFRAVVAPQTVAAGTRLFAITLDGQTYGFAQGGAVSYAAGQLTRFTIQVNRKSPSGEYKLEAVATEIVPWTEDRNTMRARRGNTTWSTWPSRAPSAPPSRPTGRTPTRSATSRSPAPSPPGTSISCATRWPSWRR